MPRCVLPLRAVVYDFTDTRAGEHARAFLGDWRGSLVCDDYPADTASFALGVTRGAAWRMRALPGWLLSQRAKTTNGTATAKAIDYSLNRWAALTRCLDAPALPIDNNHDKQLRQLTERTGCSRGP